MIKGDRPRHEGLLVLDYGSQYTLLIARRMRELGVYAEIIDGVAGSPPKDFQFHGIILSGGPDSTLEASARRLPAWVLAAKVPVLGICYGLQLLMSEFGGTLRSGTKREYGRTQIHLNADMAGTAAKVFLDQPSEQIVWMSHGDDIHHLPPSFTAVSHTGDGVVAAVAHNSEPYVGLQYHPEVHHTEWGARLLENFAVKLCETNINWKRSDMLFSSAKAVHEAVGDKDHVLIACSGGVDSTVTAALCAHALGSERVTAVFCDHGLLRKDEVTWVADNLRELGLRHIEVLDAQELFLQRLAGVTDPEEKRKIIGRTFIEVFEKFAEEHAQEFSFLGQGTLYPDVIESAGHGAGAKVIKSHHNVGGLPETLKLPLLEPFRYLFKDEVRAIGEQLGLPASLVHRHPFPGPGLAVRVLGEVTEERLAILREADHVFIEALRQRGLYDRVWQAFVVLLPVKTVGVMGDNRTYQYTAALRAVAASDGMTAEVGDLPMSFLCEVASNIVRRVDGINRVVYDITSKPPATIEWE